ncbi:MAG: hypothetical protein KGH88_01660 [Thaumarchaeota archaeon]|nr:hypothetical protein [Nitrososphaerota archaeon]
MASLAVLVLAIGIGSHISFHSAEAKGMPKCWLNSDGTVKKQYLEILKNTPANKKFPIPIGLSYCQNNRNNN